MVTSLESSIVAASASGNCVLVGAAFNMAATSELLLRTGAKVAFEAVDVFTAALGAAINFFAASALLFNVRSDSAHEARNTLAFVTCGSLSLERYEICSR
jgi:hypothetical protein